MKTIVKTVNGRVVSAFGIQDSWELEIGRKEARVHVNSTTIFCFAIPVEDVPKFVTFMGLAENILYLDREE